MPSTQELRLIAFYLPQYHPIPENDEWWGKGFTEWTNVAQARPRFQGHYQPRLPSELGFYDLRVPEVRAEQAALAKTYGISAFCFYHYWFHGKRLLNRIVDEVLASGTPDMDFCLCWANESWRRNWDGASGSVLIEQTYSFEDDLAHIHWLAPAFGDSRYIRVNGKPLFIVYRAQDLPDPRRTTDIWRGEAQRMGIGDLYLCCVETNGFHGNPIELGFDAAVDFPPHQNTAQELELPSAFNGNARIFSYNELALSSQAKYAQSYVRHPGVVPSWDNSARRRLLTAIVLDGSTPDNYEAWLRSAITYAEQNPPDERLVFVNAWNEWAEGAYLEPDTRFGRQYLEATKRALSGIPLNENGKSLMQDGQYAESTTGTGLESSGNETYQEDEVGLNEAIDLALREAAMWQTQYRELENYTRRLMQEQKSLRFLSTRLVKELGSRVLLRKDSEKH